MLKECEDKIGYIFADKNLLDISLTHLSAGKNSYERVEFLGDRVLSFIIADILYKHFPQASEGELAVRHANLICADRILDVANNIGLIKWVRIGASESLENKRFCRSVLVDTCEALVAAIYLDGGFQKSYNFVKKFWQDFLFSPMTLVRDPKTRLQEWAQDKALGRPEYVVLEVKGLEHSPQFVVEVRIKGIGCSKAEGTNKRNAEKNAALQLLTKLTR